MKTRHQLLLLFCSALFLLLVVGWFLLTTVDNKNKTLLNQGQKDLEKETRKVSSLMALTVETWVYDNTYWDDIYNAVRKRDVAWVSDTYSGTLGKYGVNYLWILNTDGSLFFNSIPDSERYKGSFFMDLGPLVDSLKRKPFMHFCGTFREEIIEVFTAPIQPSADSNRVTPPNGYFITARNIDQAYFAKMTEYTGENQYQVIRGASCPTNGIRLDSSIVSACTPLAGIDGIPIASIRASTRLGFLEPYRQDLRQHLLVFILILSGILVVLYSFFNWRIIRPIAILANSLKRRDPGILSKLISAKNEFGELAILNRDFFAQHQQLNREIETRIMSEKALQKTAFELQNETKRAEKSDAAKSEFLSTMSHEIRTPLNGVIGISNLLMEENLTVKQKELVNILQFSSRHLLSIITDILDFSKIESGKMQFDHSSFDMEQTCRNAVNLFETKAKERNLRLTFTPAADVPYSLYGDSVRLTQILANLLSNAIKFTDRGFVRFEYKPIAETATQVTFEFTVQDSGIGIAAEKQKSIFDGFNQADRNITSQYGGTGLGLTISKKLVELQGGKMELKSAPGHGSIFTFTLSFEKHAYVSSGTPSIAEPDRSDLTGMKVLVVEDNLVNVHVLRSFLSRWKVDADYANNGKEAIDKLDMARFDIVLMDLHMPVLDGKEATAIIRNSSQKPYCSIPIVALTADATSEIQHSIGTLGFTEFLSKPFNPDSLYKILHTYYEN